MPRIPFIDPDKLTPAQREVYDAVLAGPRRRIQGPLLVALHNPALADAWQKLGTELRYRTIFPPRLSEIAILVTAQRWRCQLEWHLHASIARQAGVDAAAIEAIRRGRRPDGAADDAAEIYDFAREQQDLRAVSAPTYGRVLKRWGVTGVVELTALIGYYTMVAMTLNSHEFPLPAGATAPFPDGE
jgi:4-carboxymuconolactone decarboxylase